MNPRLRTAIIVLALFVAAWLPRVMALDAFVTIDERKWLARSANFYQAISAGDLANTFQREHPGVTVMWAGTLGFLTTYPDYAADAPGQFAWEREEIEAWLAENTDHSPLELLAAGRWWMVLGIALAATASFWPLRHLLGENIAAFVTLYLAWTPFFIALSRQLHLDGLVSALSLLSLLCLLAWLYADRPARGRERWLLGVSGFAMGLAWLTKTPAILLVPTAAILMGIEWFRRRRQATHVQGEPSHPRPALHLAVGFVLWGLIATATFVLLWPAMWIDPLGTFARMAAEMSDYVEGHVNPNYFLGRPTSDPGPLFYPIAWFLRTTPLTVVGLAGATLLAWRRQRPFDSLNVRRLSGAMVLFTLLLTVVLTLTAKKFDRYLLPAFISLEVVAALGWVGLAYGAQRWWQARRPHSHLAVGLLTLGLVVTLHGLLALVHYPYYLTYYNPLAGGSWSAPKVLFVGWGEGLDEAASWLNAQPDAGSQRTVAWYHDGPLSYFYEGTAAGIGSGSPMFWLDTDYAVVYINQRQRAIPSPEAVAYFDGLEPVHTVDFRGLELAQIYDMRNTVLPDFVDIGKESAADFGERIRLAAYEVDRTMAAPGDEILATFFLQAIAPMETNYNVLVRLIGENGEEIWREEGWPWGAATTDWPLREIRPDGHVIVLPEGIESGLFKIVLSFYDPLTFQALPVTAIEGDASLGADERSVALVQVGEDPEEAADEGVTWHLGETFGLRASLPIQPLDRPQLPMVLTWESLEPTATAYTVFVHVVDANGTVVAQQDRPPLHGFAPTYTWQQGQQIADTYSLPLPADLVAGDYEVRVGLYTEEGGRLMVTIDGENGQDFAAVGSITVE